jgi:hypothetical protein
MVKESYGQLVVSGFFLCGAVVYMCIGDRKHQLALVPLERFEHRAMILVATFYAPAEIMMGSWLLHMHVITAAAWTIFGTMGIFLESTNTKGARRGIASGFALLYHGIMMGLHDPRNTAHPHALYMHQFHGGIAFIAGLFRLGNRYTVSIPYM